MKNTDTLIKVFIGDEASSILLKSRLEENGISALIKNDSSSASLGVAALSVDLYVKEAELEKAKSMIREFIKKA